MSTPAHPPATLPKTVVVLLTLDGGILLATGHDGVPVVVRDLPSLVALAERQPATKPQVNKPGWQDALGALERIVNGRG